jgi:hypothetical protein
MQQDSNGSAVASLLLGIAGLLVGVVNGFLMFGPEWDLLGVHGTILGLCLLAVIFGALGFRHATEGAPQRRTARTGLTLGIGVFVLTSVVYAVELLEDAPFQFSALRARPPPSYAGRSGSPADGERAKGPGLAPPRGAPTRPPSRVPGECRENRWLPRVGEPGISPRFRMDGRSRQHAGSIKVPGHGPNPCFCTPSWPGRFRFGDRSAIAGPQDLPAWEP